MFAVDSDNFADRKDVEILRIQSVGRDQTIFDGTSINSEERGLVRFFENNLPDPIDWNEFYDADGQGISFKLKNINEICAVYVYVCIWGVSKPYDGYKPY